MGATKDNCYSNPEKRRFFLGDEIDSSSFAFLYWEILNLIKDDDEKEAKEKDFVRKPIHLHICSIGGYYEESTALASLLQYSKTPIYTYNCGRVSSGAFVIFLAGHKRYCQDSSRFLYHQISICPSGLLGEVLNHVENTKKYQSHMEKYVASRTNMTPELLTEIREKKQDYYIDAEKAWKFGIVDEIITAAEM